MGSDMVKQPFRLLTSKLGRTTATPSYFKAAAKILVVHRFYEGCGFEPGVRNAYVAHRPT
jgi:hypothetical protein